MTLEQAILELGPWVAIVLLLWRDIWPYLRDNMSTTRKAEIEREKEERESKRKAEEDERKRNAELQERFSKSLDRFSEQMHAQSIALTTVAERLAGIERDQDAMRLAMIVISDRMGLQVRRVIDKETEAPRS